MLATLAVAWDTASAESSRRWACEPGACRAGFVLHTFWHDVEGSTLAVTALLESESGDPRTDGHVSVTVEAATLATGIDKRDRRMREEHLETAGHPLIEFRSAGPPVRLGRSPAGSAAGSVGAAVAPVTGGDSRSTAAGRDGASDPAKAGALHRLEIRGELTLHGGSKALSLPIELSEEGESWVARGRFAVRLSDFGIPDPSVLLNKVEDEVDAWFEIRLSPRPSP